MFSPATKGCTSVRTIRKYNTARTVKVQSRTGAPAVSGCGLPRCSRTCSILPAHLLRQAGATVADHIQPCALAHAGPGRWTEQAESAASVKRLIDRDRKEFLGNTEMMDKYKTEFGEANDTTSTAAPSPPVAAAAAPTPALTPAPAPAPKATGTRTYALHVSAIPCCHAALESACNLMHLVLAGFTAHQSCTGML